MKKTKKFAQEYISEFVYGGTDGIISTFGVVATAAGAHLGSGVILIMGVASLIADGLSMGVGAYLAARSEADKTRKRKRIAHKQVHQEQAARNIIKSHMKGYGITGSTLQTVTNAIVDDHDASKHFLEKEEYEVFSTPPSALKIGIATFIAFLVFGFVPLFVYTVDFLFTLNLNEELFKYAASLTFVSFAGIGYLKSRVTASSALRSVLENLTLGVVAAIAAYSLGFLLEGIVG